MIQAEYTHIVVGAGSAGCVVAATVAENPQYHVLLVEAGPDYNRACGEVPLGVENARKVPMKGQSEIFDPRVDWDLLVDIPGDQTIQVPQAKIMGGGSSINGGTALRSTKTDSAEWVELGNDSWDFESVCQTYQVMEDDEMRGTRGFHPIVRTLPQEAGQIQRAFLEAAAASGLAQVLDFNSVGAEGVGPSPVCRHGDRRISASNTFIDPVRKLQNLTILTETQVDRIIISDKAATGVLLVNGQTLSASEEVILSAGPVFSPAILQRSGVGPSNVLASLGLSIVSALPVGHNLSDHLCVPIVAKPRPGAYQGNDYSLEMQARWSSSLHPGTTDLQMVCFSYLNAHAPQSGVEQRTIAGSAVGHVAGIGCNLNKPTSLGTVSIKSVNPREAPKVAPNYLATDHDRHVAREIVRRAYRIITSDPMQRVLAPPIGLDEPLIVSDELLDAWIQRQYSTTYHFCGTCRMAPRDREGVVDQSGRVYGVRGLRVCDSSIIPTPPAANNMWTAMMFAQRIGVSIRSGKDVCRSTNVRTSRL